MESATHTCDLMRVHGSFRGVSNELSRILGQSGFNDLASENYKSGVDKIVPPKRVPNFANATVAAREPDMQGFV